MLKVRGEVKEILKEESGVTKAGKEWRKVDFLIMQEGKFPELLCVTLFGEKIDLISRIGVGEVVDVGINLVSREYNGKYFHNINGFSVDVVLEPANTPPTSEGNAPNGPEEDDLPF